MTREEAIRRMLRDRIDKVGVPVDGYNDTGSSMSLMTLIAVDTALAFADAEAAAMRERAAETAIRYGDETVYEDEEYAAGEIAKLIRALPATGEVGRG